MKPLQPISTGVGIVAAALALFTSTGYPLFAPWDPALGLPVLVVVFALGAACGLVAAARSRAEERQLWVIVDDSSLTSGERELAHREAASAKKAATVMLMIGPIGLGLFCAYQLKAETIGVAELTMVAPLAGFGAGLGLALWRTRDRSAAPTDL